MRAQASGRLQARRRKSERGLGEIFSEAFGQKETGSGPSPMNADAPCGVTGMNRHTAPQPGRAATGHGTPDKPQRREDRSAEQPQPSPKNSNQTAETRRAQRDAAAT